MAESADGTKLPSAGGCVLWMATLASLGTFVAAAFIGSQFWQAVLVHASAAALLFIVLMAAVNQRSNSGTIPAYRAWYIVLGIVGLAALVRAYVVTQGFWRDALISIGVDACLAVVLDWWLVRAVAAELRSGRMTRALGALAWDVAWSEIPHSSDGQLFRSALPKAEAAGWTTMGGRSDNGAWIVLRRGAGDRHVKLIAGVTAAGPEPQVLWQGWEGEEGAKMLPRQTCEGMLDKDAREELVQKLRSMVKRYWH